MASPLWGLYDDVAPPSTSQSNGNGTNKSTVAEEWSSNSKLMKLMAPQLRKKTATQTSTPTTTKPKPSTSSTQNTSQSKNNSQHSSFITSNISVGVINPDDDLYDPTRPNDYEKRKKKKMAELERERKEKQEREKHNNFAFNYNDNEDNSGENDSRKRSRSPSPEGLHPSLLALGGYQQDQNDEPLPAKVDLHISGEEAYLRRARLSNAVPPPQSVFSNNIDGEELDGQPMEDNIDGEDLTEFDDDSKQVWTAPQNSNAPPASKKGKPSTDGTPVAGGFAARMMAKMGWKGQGLGKDEQGIKAPLQHKKTNYNSGVIVESAPAPSIAAAASKQQQQHQQALKRAENSLAQDKKPGMAIPKSTSKVLLLKNMVGPGEVDPDLESEVASECSKYGQVSKCLIFECLKGSLPDEQAVRIFVQFGREESAVKAYVALNHRFFGGRIVSASFFDEDRFLSHDLAPKPGE
eukprot:TRINITY_DN2610_c0_g1_i2.p1 TRINITY_DN2610_c0_g1~~TRINITY_DN2610_c0_g1_i2.p1  ORF type:complete len:464 (-),score=128.56 TRINITY_DN2610_c0_g1_i2:1125-2516(-)